MAAPKCVKDDYTAIDPVLTEIFKLMDSDSNGSIDEDEGVAVRHPHSSLIMIKATNHSSNARYVLVS